MNILKYIYLFAIVLSMVGCKSKPNASQGEEIARQQDDLVRINKYLVGKDADRIKGFLKRRHWDMQTSQSGLFYMIYEKGNGEAVTEGKQVSINYKVFLLDGTLCYTSDKLGPKKFRVGKGGVETGLDEGIRMLRVGDKARFILPPHLAHGLIGDEDKIPSRSIILYEVELTQITN